jgi:hypothetical protein
MGSELKEFQRYQIAFSAHVRDPNQPKSGNVANLPADRIGVYEEIVFNNLFESVSACFPVTQKVLGQNRWRQLVRGFMQTHSANSPIFREIPQEFLQYLAQASEASTNDFPPFLYSLCHYEWIELAVASAQSADEMKGIDTSDELMHGPMIFAPGMQLLHYDYAVHQISQSHQPTEPTETYLTVFRNQKDEVKFIELNAVTYRLLALLQVPIDGAQALKQIAEDSGYEVDAMINFGREILEDLKRQELIIGTQLT